MVQFDNSNGKLYAYEGNYETFLELKTQREEEQQRIQEKTQALYKHIREPSLLWIYSPFSRT